MAKGEYTESLWDLIRQEYQAGASVNALSKKHGPSRPSIDYRARTQGWYRDPLMQEAIAATAAATLKSKNKKDTVKRAGLLFAAHSAEAFAGDYAADKASPVERIARDRVQLIEDHQTAWDDIYQLREDAKRLLRGEPTRVLVQPKNIYAEDGTTILERAELLTLTKRVSLAAKLIAIFEADARAMMTAQEGERRAYGFDYKTQLEDTSIDQNALRRRRELAGNVIELVKQLKGQSSEPPAEHPPTIESDVA